MAGITEPIRATSKYVLHDVRDDDVKVQLSKLTCQLEMLTTNKVHEVPTKEVEPCHLCEGVEHSTHDFLSIPVLKESFNQGEHISVNAMIHLNKPILFSVTRTTQGGDPTLIFCGGRINTKVKATSTIHRHKINFKINTHQKTNRGMAGQILHHIVARKGNLSIKHPIVVLI